MKERLITGIIGGALFVCMVILGGWIFTLFIMIVASAAFIELLKIKNISPVSLISIISLFSMWLLLMPSNWFNQITPAYFTKIEVLICMFLILLMFTVITKNTFSFSHVGFVAISVFYVGFGFHYLIITRMNSEHGMFLVFFILFLIWTTDSAAYFVGRSWGRTKLSPYISPNKTIEGSLGGITAALIIGTLFYIITPIFPTYVMGFLFILIVSTFGQLGDLVQSALKRHYGVKDTGNILPGHGGILDRFDSLIYVLPILHVINFI